LLPQRGAFAKGPLKTNRCAEAALLPQRGDDTLLYNHPPWVFTLASYLPAEEKTMSRFLLGTACLVGVAALLGRRACGSKSECGPRAARGFGRLFPVDRMVRWLAHHVDATDEQRRVIRSELETVFEATRELRRELRFSADDVARAMRQDAVDDAFFGDAFLRQDERIRAVRTAFSAAIARIHAVLDERQRARLAQIVERRAWA